MSRQESRTLDTRRASRLALVALLGAAATGFSDPKPVPAPASMLCSSSNFDDVKMSQGRADFGGDPHLLGGRPLPAGSAGSRGGPAARSSRASSTMTISSRADAPT